MSEEFKVGDKIRYFRLSENTDKPQEYAIGVIRKLGYNIGEHEVGWVKILWTDWAKAGVFDITEIIPVKSNRTFIKKF